MCEVGHANLVLPLMIYTHDLCLCIFMVVLAFPLSHFTYTQKSGVRISEVA